MTRGAACPIGGRGGGLFKGECQPRGTASQKWGGGSPQGAGCTLGPVPLYVVIVSPAERRPGSRSPGLVSRTPRDPFGASAPPPS